MKIWLNGRKIKQTDRFILCDECVLMRIMGHPLRMRCLAKIFNLQGPGCMRGYQYENNV